MRLKNSERKNYELCVLSLCSDSLKYLCKKRNKNKKLPNNDNELLIITEIVEIFYRFL